MERTCHLEALAGRAARCTGEGCGFWQTERGCALDGVGAELAGRSEVALLLLDVRDRLAARREDDRVAFARSLNKTAQHEPA